MRTMKKILALSLVLAMAFSLMAGAAYKDQDKINKDLVDDINMMIALNVYNENGTGEGYFEPNGIVTREQAAKLVYVLRNKGVDNGAVSWTGIGTFKDVGAGRWSEGYIEYCAATGMIVGDGTGNFNPTQPITGNALAKLLLVMIGYKSDAQGYTGINWEANVMRDAETAGFFVEYDLPVRGQATREWAAKILTNAIDATKVRYVDGQLEEQYGLDKKPSTFANTDLGMKEVTAYAMGTKNFTLNSDAAPSMHKDGKTSKIATAMNEDGTVKTTVSINFDMPQELLGQKVVVRYKDGGDGLTSTAKVYGVTSATDIKTYTVKFGDITTDKVGAADATIKFAGFNDGQKKTVGVQSLPIYNNMHGNTTADFASLLKTWKNTAGTIKFIDNDNDGIFEMAFVNVPTVGEVTLLNAAKNRIQIKDGTNTLININSEADYKNVKVDSDVAEDDIVSAVYDYSTGTKVLHVSKVDAVEGKITSVDGDGVVIIDGTKYKKAANYMTNSAFDPKTMTVGKTVKFYVQDNYIVYSDTSTSVTAPTNVAYVIGVAPGNNNGVDSDRIKVVLADGTVGTYNYKDITGYKNFVDIDTIAEIDAAGRVFEYRLDSNKNLSLKGINLGTNGDVVVGISDSNEFVSSTKSVTFTKGGTTTTVKVAEDSYFFLKNNDKYSVVKGSEIKSIPEDAIRVVGYDKTGVPKALFGVIESTKSVGQTTSLTYGFGTGTPYSAENDKEEVVTKMLFRDKNGAEITLDLGTKSVADAGRDYKNKIVTYEIDSDGVATVTAVSTVPATMEDFVFGGISSVDGKSVIIRNAAAPNGSSLYTIADDCIISNVDNNTDGDPKWVDTTDIVKAEPVNGTVDTTPQNNVIFKTKGTTGSDAFIITEIIVEVNGEAIAGIS